jgi:hypothetical protein
MLNDQAASRFYPHGVARWQAIQERRDRSQDGCRQLVFVVGREGRHHSNIHAP